MGQDKNGYGIISSNSNLSVGAAQTGVSQVNRGEIIKIKIRLPFDLTPPPGVQRERAWSKWRVLFTGRSDFTWRCTDNYTHYSNRVMRLRPGENNEEYYIYALVFNWIPEGLYTVQIKGPEFVYTQKKQICVGHCYKKPQIVKKSIDEFVINPVNLKEFKGVLNVSVCLDEKTGIKAVTPNGVLPVLFGSWKDSTLKKRAEGRVLGLGVDTKSSLHIKLQSAKAVIGKVSVSLEDNRIKGPLEWQTLSVKSDKPLVSAIWDFKDKSFGIGKKVSHRWMLSNSLNTRVTVFDSVGAVKSVNYTRKLTRAANGCNCSYSIGSKTTNSPVINSSKRADFDKIPVWTLFFSVLNLF